MPNDRTTIAVALLATGFVGAVAEAHPAQIPALALAVAAFVAVLAFLKP